MIGDFNTYISFDISLSCIKLINTFLWRQKGKMSEKKKKSNQRPLTPYQNERLYRAVSRLLNMGDFKSNEEAKKFVLNKAKGRSLEEIMDLTEWDLSEKAQTLAYKAMESEDEAGSLELALKAQQLQDIVETRPYMRALECLTYFLRAEGRFKEAIAQAEEMLELNPEDYHNIRDLLLGMYLETGDKKSARELIEKYPKEIMVTFIWGRALESYLSGKPEEAAKLIKKATSKNAHVLDLLTGRKKYSPEHKKYYSPGDKIEAAQCAEEMGPAWKKHPEAMRWLAHLS